MKAMRISTKGKQCDLFLGREVFRKQWTFVKAQHRVSACQSSFTLFAHCTNVTQAKTCTPRYTSHRTVAALLNHFNGRGNPHHIQTTELYVLLRCQGPIWHACIPKGVLNHAIVELKGIIRWAIRFAASVCQTKLVIPGTSCALGTHGCSKEREVVRKRLPGRRIWGTQRPGQETGRTIRHVGRPPLAPRASNAGTIWHQGYRLEWPATLNKHTPGLIIILTQYHALLVQSLSECKEANLYGEYVNPI